MRFNSFCVALVSLALASPLPAQPAATPPVFTPESFRSHVTFLADDRLEGRDAGHSRIRPRGPVRRQPLRSLGLKPARADGWYQQVPFLEFATAASRRR
jgi:hypothetical protein